MDVAAEFGKNPVSKHQIQPEYGDKMSRLTRDGTAEPNSRDQILRRERGRGNINFPCSADHVQDWQLYPVDPICVTIYTVGLQVPVCMSQRHSRAYGTFSMPTSYQ